MPFWDGTRWVEEAQRKPQPPDRLARLRDTVATLIIVVGLVGSVTLIAPVDAGTPSLSSTPTAAAVGTAVKVNGRGFPSRSVVQLLWDDSAGGMPSITTGSNGQFMAIFFVPLAPLGPHAITATASSPRAGTRKVEASALKRAAASAAFTVLGPSGADPSAAPTGSPTDPPATRTPDPTTTPTDPPADPTPRPTVRPTLPPDPTPRPTPDPTNPPPPSSDIPPMPAADLLRKSFADGSLAPFRPITYVNDHPGDLMGYACDYKTGSGVISVHDGYLDLRAKPGTGDRWNCSFVSTGMDGNGHPASFWFVTGYVQIAARLNVGHATWQGPIWMSNQVTSWEAAEIDCAEVIEGKLTYNIHGPANLQVAGRTPPANLDTNWHIFGVAKTKDHVTFTMDGKEVGRWNGSMPDPMALHANVTLGVPWAGIYPNANTPVPTFVNLAWVTVSSKIPPGL